MLFTAKERKKVESLRQKYRIEFRGEVPSHKWPDSHRRIFIAVDKLGKRQFDTYTAYTIAIEDAL